MLQYYSSSSIYNSIELKLLTENNNNEKTTKKHYGMMYSFVRILFYFYIVKSHLALCRKGDRSKMQDDVVRLIIEKLQFSIHRCWFAATCRDWYRIAREVPCRYQQNSPYVLIPHNDEREHGKCSGG